MSHLREPAARAERREGGRHGRPGPRSGQQLPELQIRRQFLRASVLPAVAVALCGAAAVLFTLRSTGAEPSGWLWAVLITAAVGAAAGIAAAVVAANRSARAIRDRLIALRRTTARSQAELSGLVERLRSGEGAPQRPVPPSQVGGGDELDQLAHELNRTHETAVASIVQAAQMSSHASSEQKVEVFVNLARRLQSLVHREIQLLDELENEVEDPELLKGLFHVDHLATRIRRHAENLAVLGGAISRRQWSNPVTMTEVLRSAIAEVEQYSRVKLVPPIDGTLRGHAVADVIHLLAELVENASVFSSPNTQVLLRASHVTAGLAVEVEDRGLGMPVTEQNKMNALLSDPDQVNVASLLSDGRIGLFVVSALARRHGIAVRLQSNIYGGVQAVILLPQALLGADSQAANGQAQQTQQAQAAKARQAHEAQLIQDAPQPAAVPEREQLPVPVASAPASARDSRAVETPALQLHMAPHVQAAQLPQQQRAESPVTAAAAQNGPLPVRGAHEPRLNPADAAQGLRPEARHAAAPAPAETTGERHSAESAPPPAAGNGRGTTGRPQLPKRRAQEHLVPQLRNEPVPPPAPQEDDATVGHDPGLMAAFQRGIGLAEAHDESPTAPAPQSAPVPHAAAPLPPHSEEPLVRQDGARRGGAELTE
ncbi:ATP-binding protein [Streptomyces cavernicola]|uniref:histidine kinase n=1 Tax=Streptomyces cavernicola TaxID=3043613 RepID=A0ABT6S7E6_9ACTN|nr:ATP-binding protein [Streptomyces sp. B-S-A6]MDI3404009.1 ATP-binding protein [Streptomyces sp. B-S-A6]